MSEILTVVFIVIAIILAFMPWAIYIELRRQGEERKREAGQIIKLLSRQQRRPDVRRCWSCGIAVSAEDETCPSCGGALQRR